MKFGDITDVAVSGLIAQRARMATTASNLANSETTRTSAGGPYRRRDPIFDTAPLGGPFADALERSVERVTLRGVGYDTRAPQLRYDPAHPDADANGMVALPNVNVVEEVTNLLSAARSYEANLTALRKVREMAQATLQIGRA
jgi:flagellar basal-body rod protein FlgC